MSIVLVGFAGLVVGLILLLFVVLPILCFLSSGMGYREYLKTFLKREE